MIALRPLSVREAFCGVHGDAHGDERRLVAKVEEDRKNIVPLPYLVMFSDNKFVW